MTPERTKRIDAFCKGTFIEMLTETQQMEIKAMFAAYGRALPESQAPEPHTEVTASARELVEKIREVMEEDFGYFQLKDEECASLILAFAKQYAERRVRDELDGNRASLDGLLADGIREAIKDHQFAMKQTAFQSIPPEQWADGLLDLIHRHLEITQASQPPAGPSGVDVEKLLADTTRCPICDWPFAKSEDEGCVPGNCSYRPNPNSPEGRRIKERRDAVAAYLRAQQAPKGGNADA